MLFSCRLALRLASLAALTLALSANNEVAAQHEGLDHATPHATPSGTMAQTNHYHFQVVFQKNGIMVRPKGEHLTPQSIAGLQGRAFFLMPGATAYSDPYPLQPFAPTAGQPAEALALQVDLSGVPVEGTKVTIQVWDLPVAAEPRAEFTVPFTLDQPAVITVAKTTEADALGVSTQATCPVGGDDLNAMGGPIKVTQGDRSLYLCCRGCLAKVQAEPDHYFNSVLSAARVGEGDKAAVAAQATCPISGKDLAAMGGPIKISRASKSVYVCCAGCIDAVKTDTDRYLGTDDNDPAHGSNTPHHDD